MVVKELQDISDLLSSIRKEQESIKNKLYPRPDEEFVEIFEEEKRELNNRLNQLENERLKYVEKIKELKTKIEHGLL